MRGGVDCNAAVTDRHAESADQRLAATEATCTETCSALLPQTRTILQKEGRESPLPLVARAENWTSELEKEKEN